MARRWALITPVTDPHPARGETGEKERTMAESQGAASCGGTCFRFRGLAVLLALVLAGISIWYVFFRQRLPAPQPAAVDTVLSTNAGQQLYANHCAQCHGDQGDGNGPAAKFLYPKPRDFGENKFRLVTTKNKIPSDADLLRVIERGMPGSSMPPFGHLSQPEKEALVAEVRELTRKGVERRLRQLAAQTDGELDQAELEQDVARMTTPGEAQPLPTDLPVFGPESVARGKHIYGQYCAGCHGATGKGDGVQDQRDDNGMPTKPRDFTRGIFKGGRELQQLYARMVLGIPGTPMPATDFLKPNEVGDVINFVLSLSDPKAQDKVEHKRRQLVAAKVDSPLTDNIHESSWPKPTAIVVSPLWWRDYPEPDLQVAALHDGTTVAIRLTWRDQTRNDHPVGPDEFEDMASIQLYKGNPEPFIGMGSSDKQLDLWLWRASWQATAMKSNEELDDYPFDTPLYAQLTRGREKDNPAFVTAAAAGNLQTHSDHSLSASSLAAKGFGSTTFRPKMSQKVKAQGNWKDGLWTVVLRRPLLVQPEEGVSMAPGERLSIGFALWDGAAGDRNGQKLVSIWHDLILSK